MFIFKYIVIYMITPLVSCSFYDDLAKGVNVGSSAFIDNLGNGVNAFKEYIENTDVAKEVNAYDLVDEFTKATNQATKYIGDIDFAKQVNTFKEGITEGITAICKDREMCMPSPEEIYNFLPLKELSKGSNAISKYMGDINFARRVDSLKDFGEEGIEYLCKVQGLCMPSSEEISTALQDFGLYELGECGCGREMHGCRCCAVVNIRSIAPKKVCLRAFYSPEDLGVQAILEINKLTFRLHASVVQATRLNCATFNIFYLENIEICLHLREIVFNADSIPAGACLDLDVGSSSYNKIDFFTHGISMSKRIGCFNVSSVTKFLN